MNHINEELVGCNLSDPRVLERFDLSECRSLNLHANNLWNLYGLPRLNNLTELNLSSNSFVEFKLQDLLHLTSLTSLDLTSNRLESVQMLGFLPNLKYLQLGNNNLTELDDLHHALPHLVYLNISNNAFSDISHLKTAFHGLLYLVEVSIKGNPVCQTSAKFSELFLDCQSLERIDEHPLQSWLQWESLYVQTPHFDRVRDHMTNQLLQHQQQLHQQLEEQKLYESFIQQQQQLHQQQQQSQVVPVMQPNSSNSLVDSQYSENSIRLRNLILDKYLNVYASIEFKTLNLFYQRWKSNARQLQVAENDCSIMRKVEDLSHSHREEIKELKYRLEQQQKDMNETRDTLSASVSLVSELRKQLEDSKVEHKCEVDALNKELKDKLTNSEEMWKTEKEVLEFDNKQLKEEVETCASSIESINAMTAALKDQLKVYQNNENKFELQSSAAQNEITALKEALKASEEKCTLLQNNNSLLQASLTSEQQNCKRFQDNLIASEVCLEALKIEFQTFKTNATQIDAAEINKKWEEQQSILAESKRLLLENRTLTEKCSKIESRISKLHAAFDELRLKNDETKSLNVELREKLQHEENIKAGLERDVRDLQEIVEKRKSDVRSLSKAKNLLEKNCEQIDILTKEATKASTERDEWRSKATNATILIESSKEFIEQLQQSIKQLQTENERLDATQKTSLALQDDLQTRLSVKSKEVEDKITSIESLNRKLFETQGKSTELLKTVKHLDKELNDSNRNLLLKETQLDEIVAKYNRLQLTLHEIHELNRSNMDPEHPFVSPWNTPPRVKQRNHGGKHTGESLFSDVSNLSKSED